VGPNTPTGLGSVNRDLAHHLGVSRWLVSRHPTDRLPTSSARSACRVVPVEPDASEQKLRACLRDLDWLLFVERPAPAELVPLAKAAGVLVGCVCNWEWTCPATSAWLYDVDLLICPTRHTWRLMRQWKERFGFGWHLFYQPWPIDVRRFQFRQRRRCGRLLFVNGTGGVQGRREDGSLSPFHRKGAEVLFEAIRHVPHLPLIVYSQSVDLPPLPRNVQLRPHQLDNRALYQEGDVCVQPSHWEGHGLQFLECQAAGMPLVTTDAAPMNEYQPADTIPVVGEELVYLEGCQPVPAQLMSAESLAEILARWHGRDLRAESAAARQFVLHNHDWQNAAPQLLRALTERGRGGEGEKGRRGEGEI
jgi:glycosyltransferase involved in cell wall biosynthesis